MDQLKAMHAFARVVETRSFTQAAISLGMPKATVSSAVRELEDHLGSRLLHRTTRVVELTQDGQVFYNRCIVLLADMDELQGLFRGAGDTLKGTLRVDMPTRLARNHVIPYLGDFLAQHPALRVEISSTDRRVDVVQEGFDCVLRVGDLEESGLVARRLGAFRIVNCASPAYLSQHGHPRCVEDLRQGHYQVHYVRVLGGKPEPWEYFDGQDYQEMALPSKVTVNHSDAYEACCLAGLGLIQTPAIGVRQALASGQLVEILPDAPAEPMPVSMVFSHRRNRSRRVNVFVEWLAERLVEPLGS